MLLFSSKTPFFTFNDLKICVFIKIKKKVLLKNQERKFVFLFLHSML